MEKTVKGTITFKSESLLREAIGILQMSKLTLPLAMMNVIGNFEEKSLCILADYKTHKDPISTVVSMSKDKRLTVFSYRKQNEGFEKSKLAA